FRLPARGDREQRAYVERVDRRDDARLVRPVAVVRVAARELERRLVGLGARVAEERALRERRVDQALREPQRGLVGEPVRHVPQPAAARGWISTRYFGCASFASTVARAGVSPCGTHASHTAFMPA